MWIMNIIFLQFYVIGTTGKIVTYRFFSRSIVKDTACIIVSKARNDHEESAPKLLTTN